MPLLNDLLDFNDHPLIPPPSAQLLPNICPLSGCSIAFLSTHATVRRRRLPGIWSLDGGLHGVFPQ